MDKSEELKARLDDAGIRYWAGDNISSVMQPGDKEELILELEDKFKTVLDGLVIDTANDPNSCLLYTSPSPRDQRGSRMPSSA